jgi:tripartite-type tricarboxylate transporter receptor subunit TctC
VASKKILNEQMRTAKWGEIVVHRPTLNGLVALILAAIWVPANAQEYPSRPVKVITQGAAGSGPDVIARIVSEQLGRLWGQQPVIINAAGAGGSTAARQAAAAPSDGYTLYMPAASAFIVMPEMFPNLPFDIMRDFVRIGFVADQPFVVGVSPSLGVSTLRELVQLSKSRPAQINYAANARGTLPHLTGERIREQAAADLTFIPYPGAAAGLQDLIGGRISMIIEGTSALMGAIQAGSIRPVAMSSQHRLPNFPDVQTVAETIPGFTATGWFALVAPAGTAEGIILKINRDLRTVLENAETKQRFQALGTFAKPMSPAETTDFIMRERETWRAVVKRVGFSTQ